MGLVHDTTHSDCHPVLLVLLFHCIVHLSGKPCLNLLCVLHNIKQRASHVIVLISISAHLIDLILCYFIDPYD